MGNVYLAGFIVACVASFTARRFSIWLAKTLERDGPALRPKGPSDPIPGGGAGSTWALWRARGLYAAFHIFASCWITVFGLRGRPLVRDPRSRKQIAGILVGFYLCRAPGHDR